VFTRAVPSVALSLAALSFAAHAASGAVPPAPANASRRAEDDSRAGRPLVVHVVVALADNEHQGIVKVKADLGDGQSPSTNLYWGAMYGVRSFLTRRAGWKLLSRKTNPRPGVLERIVLRQTLPRRTSKAEVYIVADAWDGAKLREATMCFLRYAAGHSRESVSAEGPRGMLALAAGGGSHLVCYVGHDAFMDFQIKRPPGRSRSAAPRNSMVLACKSRAYYTKYLKRGGSEPVLMTNGLLAPEAYLVDAAVRSWAAGDSRERIEAAAAVAYHTYQKCGLGAAKNLFASPSRR